mmetsp:Transcript_25223/g.37252  ORF Transcript_25223/g.37252 Transcript_25223/m.37252 type:complete len:114 (+) Transcript_25223:360-701(+)
MGKEHALNVSNSDTFFLVSANHATIRNQTNDREKVPLALKACNKNLEGVCIDQETAGHLMLSGTYESALYQYIEVKTFNCWDVSKFPASDCARKDEIDAAIFVGAKIVLSLSV